MSETTFDPKDNLSQEEENQSEVVQDAPAAEVSIDTTNVPEMEAAAGEPSYTEAVRVIKELRSVVEGASKTLFRAGEVSLPKKEMLDRLTLLEQVIPSAVGDADRLNRRRESVLSEAKTNAQRIVDEAKRNAETIAQIESAKMSYQRVQTETEALKKQKEQEASQNAAQIVADARLQADQIIRYAKQQQDEMVSRESVYHRAEVEANELMERNKQQMEQLRQKTFSYLDELLGQGENYLASVAFNVNNLAQNIHNERENLSSRR